MRVHAHTQYYLNFEPMDVDGKEPVIEEQDVYRIVIPYIPTLQSTETENGPETTQKTTQKSTQKTTPKSTQKSTQETTQKSTQKILEQIKLNPYISREELAEVYGITTDGIKYNIRKLRESGIIKRIGPDKGGHWEIITPVPK